MKAFLARSKRLTWEISVRRIKRPGLWALSFEFASAVHLLYEEPPPRTVPFLYVVAFGGCRSRVCNTSDI